MTNTTDNILEQIEIGGQKLPCVQSEAEPKTPISADGGIPSNEFLG